MRITSLSMHLLVLITALASGCTPLEPAEPDSDATPTVDMDPGPDGGPIVDAGPDPDPDMSPAPDAAPPDPDMGPDPDAGPGDPDMMPPDLEPRIPETVPIDGQGIFALGGPADGPLRAEDELPRTVRLTRAFHIGAREVTRVEFESVMGYQPTGFEDCGPDCPVENVSWHEAAAYTNALSSQAALAPCYACEGRGPEVRCRPGPLAPFTACDGYRLPTEAEWEIAARAGTTGDLQGDRGFVDPGEDAYDCDPGLTLDDGTALDALAWYCANSGQASNPTGRLAPNGVGLFDVMGNVSEWCHDGYGALEAVDVDPIGPEVAAGRVVRGGRRSSVPHQLRLARREALSADIRQVGIGFRIARSGAAVDDGCPPGDNCPECDEICDGVDNDCDGETDEGPDGAPLSEACYEGPPDTEGVGLCAGGARSCVEGAFGACVGQVLPAEDVCDDADNDCDGAVDDVDGLSERCGVGVGICRSAGVQVCGPDGLQCGAVPLPAADAEACENALDDDCDGAVDEEGCIFPCDVDDDCGADGLCEDGACEPGDCRQDADCGPGELCEDAFCRPGECRADDACAEGEICDDFACVAVPAACDDPPQIRGFGVIEGSTADAPAEMGASCAGRAGSPERVYRLRLPHTGTICVSSRGSDYDTALHARSDCARPSTELACNDDFAGELQSQIEFDLDALAPAFLVIDGFGGNRSGAFVLDVRPGPCGACEVDDQCDRFEHCAEPPAELPQVPIAVDARVECGRDASGETVAVEGLAPWPAYAAFYTGGAGIFDVDSNRQTFGVSLAVDQTTKASSPPVGGLNDLAAVEAAFEGVSTSAFGVTEGARVEAFFLDAFCGDNAGVVEAEVRPVAACTDRCAFDDDCRNGLVCAGRVCRRASDTDSDGVPDHVDLDDDNDGIPDAVECFGAGPIASVNGSFERPLSPPPEFPNTFEVHIRDVPGWSHGPRQSFMEFWVDGFGGNEAPDGGQFIELNSRGPGHIFQDLEARAGTRFDITFAHRGRLGPEEIAVRIGPPDAPVEVLRPRGERGQWTRHSLRYVVPDGQPITRFEFESLVDDSQGNLLDAVHIVPRCDGDQDADGDGVPNHLDFDSDGDGLTDAVEAGHGAEIAGRVVGPHGTNGLADALETAPDARDLDYVIADTDGDGVPDFLQP